MTSSSFQRYHSLLCYWCGWLVTGSFINSCFNASVPLLLIAITDKELVSSVFLQGLQVKFWTVEHSNLNGEQYLQLINEGIDPHLQENFEQQQRGDFRRLWWKQDSAPSHRRIIVGERLRELFNHRVIELWPRVATKVPWINSVWFFLWCVA